MSDATYIPGTCNLGKSEVRRRQVVALVGLVFSLISLFRKTNIVIYVHFFYNVRQKLTDIFSEIL
jgi:hypothetical protein